MASFWLEYIQDGQRREFSFDSGTISIGRDKTADFVLDHPTVSRQHALIRVDQRGPQLVVLSRGGLTAIDGGQVHGEVQIYDGTEIHFGQLSFTFRAPGAPRPQMHATAATAGFGGGLASLSQDAAPIPQQPAPQQPAPHGNNGASNSWDTDGNGWGNADWDSAPAPSAPAADSDAIVSWDDIAKSAEEAEAAEQGATDFQRIQAAQAKADKQTRGNNPLILYGGVLGIVALLVWSFWPKPPPPPPDTGVDVTSAEVPFIAWERSDIDCVGQANCRADAIDAYRVGMKFSEQAGADITNPYQAYKQFSLAQELLKKGGIQKVPDEMTDVTTQQARVKDGLDRTFQQHKVNYLNLKKRSMFRDMADQLTKLQAYFPDKRCLYNQWAVNEERKMKEEGTYPNTFRPY